MPDQEVSETKAVLDTMREALNPDVRDAAEEVVMDKRLDSWLEWRGGCEREE